MTESDSRSVVRAFLDAFAAGDLDGMMAQCASDLRSIDYSAAMSGIRGEYVGADGLAEQMTRYDDALDTTSFEVEELIGSDDTIVARTRLELRSKRNGETHDGPLLVLYEVAGGKITRMETYPTEPETLYSG